MNAIACFVLSEQRADSARARRGWGTERVGREAEIVSTQHRLKNLDFVISVLYRYDKFVISV